jgi:hypothetical protein
LFADILQFIMLLLNEKSEQAQGKTYNSLAESEHEQEAEANAGNRAKKAI